MHSMHDADAAIHFMQEEQRAKRVPCLRDEVAIAWTRCKSFSGVTLGLLAGLG